MTFVAESGHLVEPGPVALLPKRLSAVPVVEGVWDEGRSGRSGDNGMELRRLWTQAGHQVSALGREGGDAAGSDVLVVAVPSSAIPEAPAALAGTTGLPTAKSFNTNFAAAYECLAKEPMPPSNLFACDPPVRDPRPRGRSVLLLLRAAGPALTSSRPPTSISAVRIAVLRRQGAERAVHPLELFFDLVYVFAIGQLSQHLLDHVVVRTGAETVIMTLAVLYAWYMVAWAANWLDPDRLPVRLLLIGLMFASLLMSAGIHAAFEGRAWLFVAGYLLIQVPRSVFLIVVLRGKQLGAHFVNDLTWEVLAGALWIAGAIGDGDFRLTIWGAAVVVTYVGVSWLHWLPGRGRAIDLAHTEIAAMHLVERFRLFFIIALGETVLTMGSAFTHAPFEPERLVALSVGFTGTVALWWCYFHRAERIGVELAEQDDQAGTVGWLGTWTLTVMVLGLVGIAVGDELAIAHPRDGSTPGFALITFGGPALFLIAQTFFLRATLGRVPRSRPFGVIFLAVLGLVTGPLALIGGIICSTAVLVAVALTDSLQEGRHSPTARGSAGTPAGRNQLTARGTTADPRYGPAAADRDVLGSA